jgi:hypothetical protein
VQGAPTVISSWRKQNPKTPDAESNRADLVVTAESTAGDLEKQLEPAIRAALATGAIRDEGALRSNLFHKAHEFLLIAQVLERTPQEKWWASRFRLDIGIDASGKVTPVTSVGVESRFRFEWHRIMKKTAENSPNKPLPSVDRGVYEFVTHLAEDLVELSAEAEPLQKLGFEAHTFRVGIGHSTEGNIGIAKSKASVTGHIYFATDVKKPVVNPPNKPGTVVVLTSEKSVLKLDRGKFRKGLRKAMKISHFFARGAAQGKGKWKVYELKTGFDLSVSGSVGLVTVGGTGTTEIAFYNRRF